MKILVFSQSKDILGGANRSLLDIILAMSNKYGYEFLVISPGKGKFTQELEKYKINYICFSYEQVSFVKLGDYKDGLRYLNAILKEIKNKIITLKIINYLKGKNFDLVYINDTTNIVGYYVAKYIKKPFVWHFRGYHFSIKKYMLNEKKFLKDKNGICIAISNAMKNYMIETRGMKASNIKVIYNGIKIEEKKLQIKWNKKKENELHCLHCGHLSEAKGQTESIKAIFELKKRGYKNIFLHLAGSPLIAHGISYKDILESKIKEYKIENQVIFEGEVKDMKALRERMDIELMCSVAEPFGRVTIEGMEAGLVVIGCNTGATPEIILDNINGLIYQRGNFKELADKIAVSYTHLTLPTT